MNTYHTDLSQLFTEAKIGSIQLTWIFSPPKACQFTNDFIYKGFDKLFPKGIYDDKTMDEWSNCIKMLAMFLDCMTEEEITEIIKELII